MEKRGAVFCILSLLLQQFTAQVHTTAGIPGGRSSKPVVLPGPSAGILLQEHPGLLLTERQEVLQNVLIDLDPLHTFKKLTTYSSMPVEVREWAKVEVANTQQSVQTLLRNLEKVFVVRPQQHNARPRRLAGLLISAVVMAVIGAVVGTTMSTVNSISVSQLDRKIEELQNALISLNSHVSKTTDTLQQTITFINQTVLKVNEHSDMISHLTELQRKTKEHRDNVEIYHRPILTAADTLLREVQDAINLLILGKIPLSLISTEFMSEILSRGGNAEPMQIALAFELSSCLLTYINIEQMRIGFVVRVPLVYPKNIYEMKKVINVGVWKNEILWAVKAPDYVSFISDQPDLLLVPELENCIMFKDVNFLCAGKPFKMNATQLLCGLTTETEDCLVDVSQPPADDQTRMRLVGNQWLVNSKVNYMTVHYPNHGTTTQIPYPQPVSLITVPRGVVVDIGGKTLFHVGEETYLGKIEMVDTFKGKPLVIDPDLQYLLTHKTNHTLSFNLKETNITVKDYLFTDLDRSSIAQHYWLTSHNIVLVAIFLILVFWALGVTMQLIMNTRKIKQFGTKVTDPEVDIIPSRWGKV